MKKSNIISITVLLYCFGVAFAYYSSHILNIERTFLYTYFSLLLPQIIGIVTAFILFMKNKKSNTYILKSENVQYKCPNCGKDDYQMYFPFVKVFLAVELFSMFVPLLMFCILEQSIMSIVLSISHFLNALIPTFYLDKLLDFASLKSVFLFLAVYFYCEMHHFRKSDNYAKLIASTCK